MSLDSTLAARFRGTKPPMSSVTLQTLLNSVLPDGTFLVTGNPNARVSWSRILSGQSNITTATHGDLILISLNHIQGQKDIAREFLHILDGLIQTNIQNVAIGIQGALDIVALERAVRNGIAVLHIPDDIPLDRIERSVIRAVMDNQSILEKRDQELQQELVRQANSVLTLHTAVKTISNAIHAPVVLHDIFGLRLVHSFPDGDTQHSALWQQHFAMLAEVSQHSTAKSGWLNAGTLETDYAMSVALVVESDVVGYLSAVKTSNQTLDDFTAVALQRGAIACCMLIAKQRAQDINDGRSRSDWISAWLNSSTPDDPMITSRAEQNGFNFDQVYVMVAMRWTPGGKRPVKIIRPEQLTDQVRLETQARRISAIVGQYADRTVLFLPLERAQHTGRMKQYSISISEKMSELLGGKVYCGVGRPGVGLSSLKRSLQEAEKALALVEQLGNERSVAFFGDLSLSEMLMHVRDYQNIFRFCLDWLNDIIDYDRQNNSDLLQTMSVYFANNGNMAATAKQLNVHRNTLVYRLNRIAEITQLDTDDADVQLNLHLAIKAYHLLKRLGLS